MLLKLQHCQNQCLCRPLLAKNNQDNCTALCIAHMSDYLVPSRLQWCTTGVLPVMVVLQIIYIPGLPILHDNPIIIVPQSREVKPGIIEVLTIFSLTLTSIMTTICHTLCCDFLLFCSHSYCGPCSKLLLL